MLGSYNIHTDLALEDKERYESDDVEISGVSVEEFYDEEYEIRVTEVKILTENGAKAMRKPIGTYITMEMANLVQAEEEYNKAVSAKLAKYVGTAWSTLITFMLFVSTMVFFRSQSMTEAWYIVKRIGAGIGGVTKDMLFGAG